MKRNSNIESVRRLLLLFIVCLFLSGATAIPVITEMEWALAVVPQNTELHAWLYRIHDALVTTNGNAPFLFYGYDWLAFAHFVLALLFIGPYKNPVQNIWVIQFGLIACVLVLPFAAVAGHFRGIPVWWRLVDCSFGVIGFALLWTVYIKTKRLANATPVKEYKHQATNTYSIHTA